jgi:hypothetical protein
VASLWTPELKTKVALLWGKHSDSQISRIIWEEDRVSFSRNAIIGARHRMAGNATQPREKKPKATTQVREPRQRKRQGDHHAVMKIVAGGHGSTRIIQSSESAQIAKLRCVEVVPLLLTFDALQENSCRYVYGDDAPADFRFCGHPKFTYLRNGLDVTSSYCGPHFGITLRQDARSDRFVTREIAA